MGQIIKDYFSERAGSYQRFRPTYPAELFAALSRLAPGRARAWDCATGSGQAALGLALHFEQVVASDASTAQVAHALPQDRVAYLVARAECTPLAAASIDLIVVAQALHWFNLASFYAEVERVLRPAGVFAAWSYDLLRVAPAIDAIVDHLYSHILGSYWPPERRLVERRYRNLAFPFDEVPVGDFAMTATWSLAHLLGYLRTWSATKRYLEATGEDPVVTIERPLRDAWGSPNEAKAVSWPLSLRAGTLAG